MSLRRLDQLRIRHLKFVSLLASLGTLAATAEHLSMTPSAASMMLREIEEIFGAKLFRRQGRGMALTEEGLALMPRCQTVLGEVGAMHASMVGASQSLLRIGAFPHTATTVLPKIVQRLIEGAPSWRVQIFDHSADHLLELLQAGEIDLLLGRLPISVASSAAKSAANTAANTAAYSHSIADLAQKPLYQSGLSVVVGKQHPLVGRTDLTISDLLAWSWVLPSSHSTTRTSVTNAFLREGLMPPVPMVESPSFFYSLSLVAQTNLLTCCAHSAALLNNHQTSILPVKLQLESAPISLIWRKSSVQAVRAVNQIGEDITE